MTKKVLYTLLIVSILFAFALPSYAEGEGPKVTTVRYFAIDSPPIPVGQVIEFAKTDGQLVIKWDERLGAGHILHYFILQGVQIIFGHYPRKNSSTEEFRPPQVGDVGVITGYYDLEDDKGNYKPDGVVDYMDVEELREWNPQEAQLIQISQEFYREMLNKSLVYLSYAADCPPDEYRMNGVTAAPGPYGNTYRVSKNGGVFSAWYKPGDSCGGGFKNPNGYTRWSLKVWPGEGIFGTEEASVVPLTNLDPWGFCGMLQWMRPQWQADDVHWDLKNYCYEASTAKLDNRTLAVLARLGFMDASTQYGNDQPKDFVPFVWWGLGYKVSLNFPPYHWERVDKIQLADGTVYTATAELDYLAKDYQPVLYQVGGVATVGPDITWLYWESPLVFVPKDENNKDSYFDWSWRTYEIYKVSRASWTKAVLYRLVWENK